MRSQTYERALSTAPHLLQPNRSYHIRVVVKDGVTSYWVDGECYFTYTDPQPLTSGY